MNKLWAVIVSLTLVAQVCAMVEERVPATFNYHGKHYSLKRWSEPQPLFLEQGCLKDSSGGEVKGYGITISGATEEDYALFKNHEDEIIEAVLCAYKKHPKALEQLGDCWMFGTRMRDTPVYGDLQCILQRNQQIQRDQFLKTRVIPAVAIAAAVGVAMKYRTALKRMAIKAKDRVQAWWHKSDKKVAKLATNTEQAGVIVK